MRLQYCSLILSLTAPWPAVQRTAHSLPIPAGQHDYDDDAPESGAMAKSLPVTMIFSCHMTEANLHAGANLYPAGPADCICALDSFAAVTAFLRSRLLNTFSTQAASMALRPALQEVYTNLLSLLSSTAETPGANHSFLLLGARGTGKSMVCHLTPSDCLLRYWPKQLSLCGYACYMCMHCSDDLTA